MMMMYDDDYDDEPILRPSDKHFANNIPIMNMMKMVIDKT